MLSVVCSYGDKFPEVCHIKPEVQMYKNCVRL